MTNEIEVRQSVQAIDRPVTDPAARTAVVDELEAQMLLIQEAMERTLKKGVHYGTIPGTQKPSLWQPGAEMLCQMFRFQTNLTRTGEHEDWDKGIFSYTYKCTLMNREGELITEREATCSSKEPNYAGKNAYQQRETLMQMAQKRAYVSAVRGAGAASAIFSQDDDIVPAPATDLGICPKHKVPWREPSEKQIAAGFPELWHKEGNGFCKKEAEAPVLSTESETRREAMEVLSELYSTLADQKRYIQDALPRKQINHWNDINDDDWRKVKEAAEGDLAAMVPEDEQLDFDRE